MGSRKTHEGVEKVYAAAQAWVDCALRDDDSLFTPGKPIWTRELLGELHGRVFRNLSASRGESVFDKLKTLLDGAPPEVCQLMAELVFVSYLIVHHRTTGPKEKKENINKVLASVPSFQSIPYDLADGLSPGIVISNLFVEYHRQSLAFLSQFAWQWKTQNCGEDLLDQTDSDAPWLFSQFVNSVRMSFPPIIQRNAMLHLVHPDTFEGIVETYDKQNIANAFQWYVTVHAENVDRVLQQIRLGLEADIKRDFDFYDLDIRTVWDPGLDQWSYYVRRAKAFVETGKLDSEEVPYKVEIGQRLAEAREALLAGSDEWRSRLNRSLNPNDANFIVWRQLFNFRRWCTDFTDEASKALQALWKEDYLPVTERIRAFSEQYPKSVTSGTGTRMNVISGLLMALDEKQYPPFRIRAFQGAYDATQYRYPESDADEASLYEHALGFLDRFIDEAAHRGLELRHRLDAQSVLWRIYSDEIRPLEEKQTENGSTAEVDLEALADEVYLDVDFLEEIQTLLEEKQQVIFQGPPGTGKTFVAQKLAEHIAGDKARVRLVQFHPSYAYEDFVQGYRPTQLDNGQPGFELRDGPLLRMAKLAEDSPDDVKHFLIIDEINRGNLAKILGELYFLLEYRDQPAQLQYSDKEFRLPRNLYIIGTMNTADRSIALVDLALRRRFYFVEFHPDHDPVKSVLRKWLKSNRPEMEWVADVVEKVNEKLKDDRHAAIGPSYFMLKNPDKLDEAAVKRIWKHSVLPYIEERRFGGDEVGKEFSLDKLRGETDKGRDEENNDDTNGEEQDAGG